MQRKIKARIIFTFFIFGLLFLGVLGKAFFLQILRSKDLVAYSESQYLRKEVVYPNRGIIYDRSGSPLAINIRTYNLYSMPKLIENQSEVLRVLAKTLTPEKFTKFKKALNERKKFTWIDRQVRLSTEQVNEMKKISGLFVEPEISRFYPNQELSSQMLGFVGIDNSGLAGVEYQFNNELKGKPVIKKYFRDAKGRPVKYETQNFPENGMDIHLSIDKNLQGLAEKYLKEAVLHHEADKGGVGVMDAETGEILAMANYPTYNPSEVKKSREQDRKLSFITDPFEPGSIFKTLTIASALENNIATPQSRYYCEKGQFRIFDYVIGEAEEKKKWEWMTVEDILKHSSNIGVTKIAFDLKYPRLKKTLQKFRVGEKTGIEIPGESKGIFDNSDKVIPIRLSNISFGQGVATTALQMLASYAVFANGGKYVRPTILSQSENTEEVLSRFPRENPKEIMAPKVVQDINKILVKVVEEGTAPNAIIPYFTIAGKTSTAQKPSGSGGYDGYVSVFVGFPMNVEKKFVVLAYVDHPRKNGYYGNQAAAPIFKHISQYLLYKDRDYGELASIKKGLKEERPIEMKQSATKDFLVTQVPRFVGLDKKSATELSKKHNLRVRHKGFGMVTSQSVAEGIDVSADLVVELNYEPPIYE
ncbi:MAG: hypothetical protein KBD63_01590 [Bacteriovoracaceae bacterium]|nr:hypothetical protein [Bacteriovoracaceae bacterium]